MKETQTTIHTEDGRTFHDMAASGNPCFNCGCCCRFFRVSFYHGELDSQPGGQVPAALTVPVTPFLVAMKGTETGRGRCVALGDDGRCSIYHQRPSACREFPVFLETGEINPECLRLQAIYDVAPADDQ